MRPGFSVSLLLTDRRVVVVGSGAGADDRADRLARARAEVVRITAEDYTPDRLEGAFLVMAHSDDDELDRRIARDARAAGALAYAHDQPAISDFAMPALARRGPLSVAIATSAVAPSLARQLRRELQAMLDRAGQAIDQLIERMARARAIPEAAERRQHLAELAASLRLTGEIQVHHSVPDPPLPTNAPRDNDMS